MAVRLLSSAVLLLIIMRQSLADFTLQVVAPEDPDVKNTFGRVSFPEMVEILSVTSPVPNLILGDVTNKNDIAFRGSLPNCNVPMSIIGKKADGTIVRYTGNIHMASIKPEDVTHAATVKGENSKLTDFVEAAKSDYAVSVISSTPSGKAGNSELAIVLRDKSTGIIVPKEEAEIYIKAKVKAMNTGLISEKPDCHKTCNDVCDSALVHDTSAGLLQTAVVASENQKSYAGLPTKWVNRCGKDLFKKISDVCGPNTCSNGGSCSTAASGISSDICQCPDKANVVFGPRCQQLTRKYMSSGPSSSIITHHTVPDAGMDTQTLTLSFQHAGRCTLSSGSLCTILKLDANSKQLLKVEQGRIAEPQYTSATLPASNVGVKKMPIYSDRYVQNKRWMKVTVTLKLTSGTLKANAVFCSKEANPVCFEKTATASGVSGNLAVLHAELSIGGTYNGCVRNVRINGRLVDLKAKKTTGDASLTGDKCSLQDEACGGSSGYTCGAKSVCYGEIGSGLTAPTCGCRCTKATRMTTEKITMATECAASCSMDVPIISTRSSSPTMLWTMKDGSHISLRPESPFTFEFRLRTIQTNAAEMLKIDATTTASASTIVVKIQDEVLSCCVNSVCYPFVPKPANDGNWHKVSVRIAVSQLVLRIDDHTRVHLIASAIGFTGAKVTLKLPNSCITDIRLSNIYLPTGSADPTQDSNSMAVKVTAGSGATSGASCVDPGPACACNSATEVCETRWGAKICNCKAGHKRYSGSSACTAPTGNPCTRLGITCPNAGGSCVQSGSKWLVCQ